MKKILLLSAAFAIGSVGAAGVVTYEEFGAVGDGKADDQQAIIAAHAAANKRGVPVRACDGKTYYIGKGTATAEICTDVDFGTAAFVIDDHEVPIGKRSAAIFRIAPSAKPIAIKGLTTLASCQANIGVSLPGPCLVEVVDSTVRQYIRYGLNQNNGSAKREVFLAAADGTVDPATPIIWDYGKVTHAVARPLDAKTLVIKGGRFTTIANQAESKYTYYGRNFTVNRSNVRFEGLRHDITGVSYHSPSRNSRQCPLRLRLSPNRPLYPPSSRSAKR